MFFRRVSFASVVNGMSECERKPRFLISALPYVVDINDQKAWSFVEREFNRDFPWLLADRYEVILSGVGKGWRGTRRRECISVHSGYMGRGWIPIDVVLSWVTHFVDACQMLRKGDLIAIAPTPASGLSVALARMLWKEKVRLVVRVQGHTASKALFVHRSRWRFFLLEWIETFVLRRADLVLPMGRFTEELALRKGVDPARIFVLPFPVWWAKSADVSPLPSQPCVLFMGRLEKEKGVHILLDAISLVREQIPSVRLVIAGDGSYRKELEAKATRLGVLPYVQFLGWLEFDELKRAYKEAWVLVLPSICAEGLGMVLVEAGLMGRPVIGSDLGGIRDIIRDGYNGFLVPPGDAQKLAEVITTLLKNKELTERMGLANLEVAREYLRNRDEAIEQVRQRILSLAERK
jgi:glycosyltransferase involved in cell wall biosynthesis